MLDVGCGIGNSFEAFNKENPIVGLDLLPKQQIFQDNFTYIVGNGTDMSIFKDKQFDVAVSVGVLEHVHPFENLEKIAREIVRVGKSYAVVIPHMYTPLEPHWQLPFWQLYPHGLKSYLIRNFSISWYKKNPEGYYEELNYFPKKKWQTLFPDASIISYNHIAFGIVKDFIIYRSLNN